jgi:hypothetical protein
MVLPLLVAVGEIGIELHCRQVQQLHLRAARPRRFGSDSSQRAAQGCAVGVTIQHQHARTWSGHQRSF